MSLEVEDGPPSERLILDGSLTILKYFLGPVRDENTLETKYIFCDTYLEIFLVSSSWQSLLILKLEKATYFGKRESLTEMF